MREIIQKRIDKITCDKCQVECPQPNGYASFIYLKMDVVDKNIRQNIVEEHYCSTHSDKIREYISKLK